MSKLKLSQINAVKAMYKEGKSAQEIHTLTKIPGHVIRYHIERVKLAQLESNEVPYMEPHNEYLKVIEDLKSKNKMLIEIITHQ